MKVARSEKQKPKGRHAGRIVALAIVGFMAFVVATAWVSSQRIRRAAEAEGRPAAETALEKTAEALEATRERLDRRAREQGFDSWPEMMREARKEAEGIRDQIVSPPPPEAAPAADGD